MTGMIQREFCLYPIIRTNFTLSSRISAGIREGTINISEDYFLRCFYPNGNGDPSHYEKGFLKSGLAPQCMFYYSFIITSADTFNSDI